MGRLMSRVATTTLDAHGLTTSTTDGTVAVCCRRRSANYRIDMSDRHFVEKSVLQILKHNRKDATIQSLASQTYLISIT